MSCYLLYSEKQEHLERIRSKLHAQNLQKLDDEDDRIRRAVEEAEMKRERDERAKEEKTRRAFEEMAKHRHEMVGAATCLLLLVLSIN